MLQLLLRVLFSYAIRLQILGQQELLLPVQLRLLMTVQLLTLKQDRFWSIWQLGN